jgi:Sec-independent protein secretion pathway component TatC
MTILLESDRNTTPQVHLNELTARVTVLFVSTALLTIVWSLFVDDVLQRLLQLLKPCTSACMNVYDPAQWSAVRWSTSLLLGLFSVLPLLLHHIHQFARPGLLKSEFTSLRGWTTSAVLVLAAVAYALLTYGLPKLYVIGYEQHQAAGLEAQYNAALLLIFAVYLVWVLWLFIGTWLLLLLVGKAGILTSVTADWWRLRVFGLGSLLLLVTVPEHAHSMALPLIALYIVTSEAIGRRWFMHIPFEQGHAVVRFDHEGRRRRFALIDCSCEGANLHAGFANLEGYSTVSVNALCLSPSEQEVVLEHAMRAGITDAVITGCDAVPCPKRFCDNATSIGLELHGLNLMQLQNVRVGASNPTIDVQLALLPVVHYGVSESWQHHLVELLNEYGRLPSELVTHSTDDGGWKEFHDSNTMIVPFTL